jgi:fructokinase
MSELYGGIEAGGTKFVCGVGTGPEDLRAELRFATTTPEETLGQAIDFFLVQQQKHGPLAAVGIGSFGPVDLDRGSPTWGRVTSTPKPGWRGADVAGTVAGALGVPVAFDTDVNAAALGEQRWGAARGLDSFVYVTVGTGIGGGGMVDGRLLHGLVHPEMGHMLVPHDRDDDPFEGCCPFHGDCLEGLASGPAIEKRWGRRAEELPEDHPAWELEALYLARMAMNLVTTLSPRRIVLGGGVMQQARLLPAIRRRLREMLAGYVQSPAIVSRVDSYVVPSELGTRAGLFGALALAQRR